jgi:hypothetical protein
VAGSRRGRQIARRQLGVAGSAWRACRVARREVEVAGSAWRARQVARRQGEPGELVGSLGARWRWLGAAGLVGSLGGRWGWQGAPGKLVSWLAGGWSWQTWRACLMASRREVVAGSGGWAPGLAGRQVEVVEICGRAVGLLSGGWRRQGAGGGLVFWLAGGWRQQKAGGLVGLLAGR